MQIRRALSGNPAWLASLNRNGIDDGPILVILAVIADGQHLAVERKHVIVVVAGGKIRIDGHRRFRRQIEPNQSSIVVIDQRAAVSGPIRRLKRISRTKDYF